MTPAENELVEASLAFLSHMGAQRAAADPVVTSLEYADDGLVVVGRLPEGMQERWVRAARAVKAERTEHCECLDWTQVGHPASAYWPDMHPNYHHPDCQKYTPPPQLGTRQIATATADRAALARALDNWVREPESTTADSFRDGFYAGVAHARAPRDATDSCGAADCQGSKRCEEPGCNVLHPNACSSDPKVDGWRCHKHPAERLEDLPKAALVQMAEGARVVSRGRQRFQVWEACARLRDLQDAIPMVKVLLDYLEPPRETHDGKSGWWHECLMCSARYFYSARGHWMLCPRCAGARYYEIHLGFDRKAAFLAWGPEQLGLYVLPGGEADVIQHLCDVASYLDGGA